MGFALKKIIKAVLPRNAPGRARAFLRYLHSLRYAGGALHCPLCAGSFSYFAPVGADVPVLQEKAVVGAGYRLRAVCPRCESKERDRLVYLYLRNARADVFARPLTLLHVAPEPVLAAKLQAHPNISYLSADLDSPLADRRMDVTAIEEPDDTYDVILCNHVLEHIPEDLQAMAELYRVLKPGGFAILQVPISYLLEFTYEDFSICTEAERERAFGQCDHVRIYGRDYPTRLAGAGFTVRVLAPETFAGADGIARYGLRPEEHLYVCEKAG